MSVSPVCDPICLGGNLEDQCDCCYVGCMEHSPPFHYTACPYASCYQYVCTYYPNSGIYDCYGPPVPSYTRVLAYGTIVALVALVLYLIFRRARIIGQSAEEKVKKA